MKLAILITTQNRPQRVEQLLRKIDSAVMMPHDVFIAECSDATHDFKNAVTVNVTDCERRNDCAGLDAALTAARRAGTYDYFWILTEEVSFDADTDVVLGLIDRLERERLMAIAAPTWNQAGFSPRQDPGTPDGWHAIASCELRGFVMKAAAIDEVGFLDTEFSMGVGAMHELCHRLYAAGWFAARCDDVILRMHAATMIERSADSALEHYAEACRFAYKWFQARFGPDWERALWNVTRGLGVLDNPFVADKTHWSSCFDNGPDAVRTPTVQPAAQRPALTAPPAANAPKAQVPAPSVAPAPRAPRPAPARVRPAATAFRKSPLEPATAHPAKSMASSVTRLNLGSGSDYRSGWINVDIDPVSGADIVASAESLPMFADGSISAIEALHVLPHLGYLDAVAALAEWARVLEPGGELTLELPDLEACAANLGQHFDERGFDPALTGLFGEPREHTGADPYAVHRWAWSQPSLDAALREAGFDTVQFETTERSHGVQGFERDMRVRAVRSLAAAAKSTAPATNASRDAALPATAAALPSLAGPAFDRPQGGRVVDISSWPLATTAAVRIFAWPDYDRADELQMMFNVYGRHLVNRGDVCLVLRQDKNVDGSESFVRTKLELAHSRSVGRDANIEVLLVDENLNDADWPRLGRALDCAILLPSSRGQRLETLENLGIPLLENADQLLLHFPRPATT